MTPKQLISSIQKKPVSVTIFRYTNPNYEEDPASKVGQKWIMLPEDFCITVLRSPNENISKATLREKYEIQNIFNERIGTITLSFRLCCFGSAVITQMNIDCVTQKYNFRYLPINKAIECYNQSKECENRLGNKKLMPLLTDSNKILDMKKKFITTSSCTYRPVDWKVYSQQCSPSFNDTHIETASKLKTNDTEVSIFSPKCECANILEALYKKSKVQKVLSMFEKEQYNSSTLKNKDININADSKFIINKKQSKVSIKCTYNKQDITETAKKKSKVTADLVRIMHDNKEQIEKDISLSSKENLSLNKITNMTDSTVHTIMNLQHNRRLSSLTKMLSKTDQKQCETKISKLLKKKKFLYDYTTGIYPAVLFGHKTCLEGPIFVPKTMGWLWNIQDHVTGLKVRVFLMLTRIIVKHF